LRAVAGVDALVTREAEMFLAVTVADCFPVYFYDPVRGAVGIAHAGWRGVVRGVVPETVRALSGIGCRPKNLRVVIGPGIRACHFVVGADVRPAFLRWEGAVRERRREDGRRWSVNLSAIIRAQLRAAGVPTRNIAEVRMCTYSASRRFFSRRRRLAAGERPGRMLAVIGMLY